MVSTTGVLAVVGFELDVLALAVSDERAVAVGEALQPELAAGRGRHPAHDEAGGLLLAEGPIGDLGHSGGALQPVGDGPSGRPPGWRR